MNFTFLDWSIVAAYLLGTLTIGVLGKRYVASVSNYLVAGRELGPHAGIATLAATEIGTITFMYYAELGYRYGFAAFAAAMISGLVMIVVGRTGFVIARLRELRLMTVPEYFEVRYSPGLRMLTGVLVAVGGVLNMGVFLKVEGEFLTIVTGLDVSYLTTIMVVILLLELIYTVLGGMVSIAITDFIQYALLSVAAILVSIWVVFNAGWSNMVRHVETIMGPPGFNPFTSPKFGLSFILWQVVFWFAIHTCWQTTAMRMFSTKGPEVAKKVMTWTGFIFVGRGMLPMLWGIGALTLMGTGPATVDGVPSPMLYGKHFEVVQAMPAMLSAILGPGIRGIVVAGMLAATMSVNSSYLLGWSAVISQDIIGPLSNALGRARMSSSAQILVNRIANAAVSLFVMFWGLFYKPPGAVYLYLNVTATIFLAGVFTCVVGGLYWKRSNVTGGYAAMLLGAGGAMIPYFVFHAGENFSGFAAFVLSAAGFIIGSLAGSRPRVPEGNAAASLPDRS
jgi:solute:Na+ symporter, SSS family